MRANPNHPKPPHTRCETDLFAELNPARGKAGASDKAANDPRARAHARSFEAGQRRSALLRILGIHPSVLYCKLLNHRLDTPIDRKTVGAQSYGSSEESSVNVTLPAWRLRQKSKRHTIGNFLNEAAVAG
jgi:transposase-like protein